MKNIALNMPLVSVIMPVYNARKYVEQAIESVLNQSYENIELILIDDGATDGSGEVCDRFAQTDARVMVLHQRNGGICNARNNGIKRATGKYLAFCDHDDEMLPDCIERAVGAAEKNCASIVKFTHRTEQYINEQLVECMSQELPDKNIPVREVINDYPLFNAVIRALWNGIYLTRIVKENNLSFDESVKFGTEDYLFNLSAIEFVERVTMLSQIGYVHYARVGQSTNEKYSESKLKDWIKTAVKERNYFSRQPGFLSSNWVYHQAHYLCLYIATLLHPDSDLSFREKCIRLKEINTPDQLGLNYSMVRCFRYLREQPKQAVAVLLFNMRLYGALVLAWSLYKRIQNGGGRRVHKNKAM